LPLLQLGQVVDTGLRRRDGVGGAGGSIVRAAGIIVAEYTMDLVVESCAFAEISRSRA
jgi:hypothetical protein